MVTELDVRVTVQTVGDLVILELPDRLMEDDLLYPISGMTLVWLDDREEKLHVDERSITIVDERPSGRRFLVSDWQGRNRWLEGFLEAARQLREDTP